MKRDPLKQFVSLRNALQQRKQELEAELLHINRALGVQTSTASTTGAAAAPAAESRKAAGRKAGAKRARRHQSQAALQAGDSLHDCQGRV